MARKEVRFFGRTEAELADSIQRWFEKDTVRFPAGLVDHNGLKKTQCPKCKMLDVFFHETKDEYQCFNCGWKAAAKEVAHG